MTYHLGISGSRYGMTSLQKSAVTQMLATTKTVADCWLHHGDCVGVDAEVCVLARDRGYLIHNHPPLARKLRAYTPYDLTQAPKNYLQRNRDIVVASSMMFIVPNTMREKQNGGTWYTYRYAKGLKKPVIVFYPDGLMAVVEYQ